MQFLLQYWHKNCSFLSYSSAPSSNYCSFALQPFVGVHSYFSMVWLVQYRRNCSFESSHLMVLKLDNDFHKYHVAILLYGLHGSAISIILLGLGSSSNRYVLFIAFLNPKSVTGNMSFLARQNIMSIFLYLLLLLVD